MRETKGSFDSCDSCKRLGPGRLRELHVSKLPFVLLIEFFRCKLKFLFVHVNGVGVPTPHR